MAIDCGIYCMGLSAFGMVYLVKYIKILSNYLINYKKYSI